MNSNNHTLDRIHDSASFAWLSSLTPSMEGTPSAKSTCFGMDAIYLHSDMLTHYPNDIVLAIPPLDAPPIEYGFACTSKGDRWFCFVIVRKSPSKSAALIFEVTPYVLMFPAQGLRETSIDKYGALVIGRDYPLPPLLKVLCPMDGLPIRHENLQVESGQYFCLCEGEPTLDAWQTPPANHVVQHGSDHATAKSKAQNAPIFFEVGGPAFPAMRINGNAALINLIGGLQ